MALEEGKATGSKGKDKEEATTWKRSQIVPNSSRVMVGDRDELALRSMQTQVTIDGYRARVVIDYVYANEHSGMLEGTFQLRLPEGASPYFFAFGETSYTAKTSVASMQIASNGDVEPTAIMRQREAGWRAPKEARMVPRETAAIAYTSTVRRRVDPALVEWAGAGVFSARVYPLTPQRLHRIVIGYDVDLTSIDGDLEYRFDSPEHVPASVVDVSVAAPHTAKATPAVPGSKTGARTVFHFEDKAARAVAIRIAKPVPHVLVGGDIAAGPLFAARVTPELPATAVAGNQRAVFLVDTSLSSNPDRFNIYLKLLRAVLDKNRDTVTQFNVLFFSVDAHWYKQGFVANTPAEVDALLAVANGLALEGATDLGGALGETGKLQDADLFLLSDGAATWGESNLHALGRLVSGKGPLFAYQTGLAGTDTSTLAHLTRDSGGALFSVTGEAEIDRAAVAHRARPWRLVGIEVKGGSDVLVAGNPTALFPGQRLTVVGRGELAGNAVLALTVEQARKRMVVTTSLGKPITSTLAARAYGEIATAHLEELEAATEPQARAYATHFRVTGHTCSLLMLESEEDYRRFNIKPEDDAYVIKATPAAALFAKALGQTIETLGEPKAAFVAMLDRLAKSPHVKLQMPAAYRTVIDQLPREAFVVPAKPLVTRARTKQDLAPGLADRLAKHQIEYDAITDAANARRKHSPADALKALSSLVEENPGDAVLARDVGFSALELGLGEQAYHLFRRVADARPYEPQTYRAIGQALAAMGKHELALAYYEIPLMAEWDPRFGELQAIVRLEYLRLLRTIAITQSAATEYAKSRLVTVAKEVGIDQADVVVTIMWNTDYTDVDLHVREPTGEESFYGNRTTRIGGQLTRDVTQGYGPEMYVLRNAPKGKYRVDAHYFASDSNRTSVRTKVQVTIVEDWGTAQERVTDRVVTLEYGKDRHTIATVVR
jgi:hypothetical protein